MGDVMGDINRRRGMLQGMDDSPSGKVIRAKLPLAEMFGYATDLRYRSSAARAVELPIGLEPGTDLVRPTGLGRQFLNDLIQRFCR